GLDVARAHPHGGRAGRETRDRHADAGDASDRGPHHLRVRRRRRLAGAGPAAPFPPGDRAAHRRIRPDAQACGRARPSGRGGGVTAMKIHNERHRLHVTVSDLSGSLFDDVNLSGSAHENANMSGGSYHNINLSRCTLEDLNMAGWRVHDVNLSGLRIDKANLAGASIVNSRLAGMTIDGIEVTELLAAWKEKHAAKEAGAA